MRLRCIVSGGQSGVDRAALDAAGAAGLEIGGWCPRGRWAEDGPIPARYPLEQTPDAAPEQRTAWNVRDSDATLVLLRDSPLGGTAWTVTCAREKGRPLRIVQLEKSPGPEATHRWLVENQVARLNVAGPRESQAPGIGAEARDWLERLFAPTSQPPPPGEPFG